MACRPKLVLRILTASANGLLVQAKPASARVSLVSSETPRGGTQTFAVPLANKLSDTSNRLELVFARKLPIAFAEAAQFEGWTATIQRRLNPAAKLGDQVISGKAAAIVLDGGTVLPGQFEHQALRGRRPPAPAADGDRADVPDEPQDGACTDGARSAEVTKR